LSSNTVTFTCVSGQFFIQSAGVTLNPGDTYTFSNAVPLVPLFSSDPHTSAGSFGGFATCDNTQMAVQARIDWSSSERIHVLHGIVRECYQENTGGGGGCSTFCNGSPAPSEMYLTLSGVSTASEVAPTSGASTTPSMSFMNGTYVVSPYQRNYGICDVFISGVETGASIDSGQTYRAVINYRASGIAWPVTAPPQPAADTWISGTIRTAGITYQVLAACRSGIANVCSATSGAGTLYVTEIPVTVSSRFFKGSFSWSMTP
jgi:hypothetical protein